MSVVTDSVNVPLEVNEPDQEYATLVLGQEFDRWLFRMFRLSIVECLQPMGNSINVTQLKLTQLRGYRFGRSKNQDHLGHSRTRVAYHWTLDLSIEWSWIVFETTACRLCIVVNGTQEKRGLIDRLLEIGKMTEHTAGERSGVSPGRPSWTCRRRSGRWSSTPPFWTARGPHRRTQPQSDWPCPEVSRETSTSARLDSGFLKRDRDLHQNLMRTGMPV